MGFFANGPNRSQKECIFYVYVYLFQTLKSRVSQIVTTFVIFDRNNLRTHASLQHQSQLYKLTNYTLNDYKN